MNTAGMEQLANGEFKCRIGSPDRTRERDSIHMWSGPLEKEGTQKTHTTARQEPTALKIFTNTQFFPPTPSNTIQRGGCQKNASKVGPISPHCAAIECPDVTRHFPRSRTVPNGLRVQVQLKYTLTHYLVVF